MDQINKEDTISRQAAIDLVKDVCEAILSKCGSHYDGEDEVYDDPLEVDAVLKCNKEIRTALKHMPSAQLETNCSEIPNNWIPCSERLPEYDMCRTLTTINTHVKSGYYYKGLFYNDNGDTWKATDKEVIAWMPLPEPYAER